MRNRTEYKKLFACFQNFIKDNIITKCNPLCFFVGDTDVNYNYLGMENNDLKEQMIK
jgi:hypothetical protein